MAACPLWGAGAALLWGCDGGTNDRHNMSVFDKQINLERAEVVMRGPRLCQVSGALSLQFLSLVHFHRLSAAAGFEDCSVSASGPWTHVIFMHNIHMVAVLPSDCSMLIYSVIFQMYKRWHRNNPHLRTYRNTVENEIFFFSFCLLPFKNALLLGSTPGLCHLCLVAWWEKGVVNHAFNVQIKVLFISVLEMVLVESNWEINSHRKIKIVL